MSLYKDDIREYRRQHSREWYRRNRRSKRPQVHAVHRCTSCDQPGHNSRTCMHTERTQ